MTMSRLQKLYDKKIEELRSTGVYRSCMQVPMLMLFGDALFEHNSIYDALIFISKCYQL